MSGTIPPLPNTPSWRGALLKHRDNFTFLHFTQPPIRLIPGALSLRVKRPGLEVDHSPPSSAEVKNEWSYTSTPQYTFTTWCSIKAQGQLYLYVFVYGTIVIKISEVRNRFGNLESCTQFSFVPKNIASLVRKY
jgi:hypothetical protein